MTEESTRGKLAPVQNAGAGIQNKQVNFSQDSGGWLESNIISLRIDYNLLSKRLIAKTGSG